MIGNTWIRSVPLLASCLLGLSGCFFGDDDEPEYPPLTQEKIVGCWFQPGQEEDCKEQCFDANLNIYYLGLDSNIVARTVGVLEWLGTYKVVGRNTTEYTFQSRLQLAGGSPQDLGTNGHSLPLSVQGDTVYSVGEGGNSVYMIKSDSAHNCGMHWRLFSKPGNWSLN